MKLVDEFPCDVNHEILHIISSETRRHILQLIATESNYGNRLASILNLSTPGVHRHLRTLLGRTETDAQIIGETKKTRESYSGRKGAEATHYEIISQMGLFFGVFPNFIHSQVVELEAGGEVIPRRIDPENFDPELFGVKIQEAKDAEECSDGSDDCFNNHFKKIQEINKHITEQQEGLMSLLYLKNELIDNIFNKLEKSDDLGFEERVVLKSIIAYGLNNIKLIAQLLNTDENVIRIIIQKLRDKKWIVDKEIVPISNHQ